MPGLKVKDQNIQGFSQDSPGWKSSSSFSGLQPTSSRGAWKVFPILADETMVCLPKAIETVTSEDWAGCHRSVIPALGSLKEDGHKLNANLEYNRKLTRILGPKGKQGVRDLDLASPVL